MSANSQALRVEVESDHGEDLDHIRQDYAHILVTILS